MIQATVSWTCSGDDFTKNRYSRAHTWKFDGGAQVAASSSPDIVPVPLSDASAVDPEEAFVAALASCHMLCFLSLAAKAGFVVHQYQDCATGEMQKNELGKRFISVVRLHPQVTWEPAGQPTADQLQQLHHRAHEECFIANSVKTQVLIDPYPV